MRILHFSYWDNKFLPLVESLYEEVFPGRNAFRILDLKNHPVKGRKAAADFRKVSEAYFYSKELKEESRNFDLLVVHSMPPLFAAGVKNAHPDIYVVWCGWGYDYYDVMGAEFKNLIMPDTRQLLETIQRKLASGFHPSRLANALKGRLQRLLKLPQPAAYRRETLKTAAGRINLFSVLPNEAGPLQRALPELHAVYHKLLYYTTEDVLAKGPDRMRGPGILLGNSTAPTNNHLEALKALHAVLPADREILVPLNYGKRHKLYADGVSKFGHTLFGKRFKPFRAWMTLEQYHQQLERCGIVVMNHRRQQGLGTISTALYKGAKVFLRPENPVYGWYQEMGAAVFNIEDLTSKADAFNPLSEKDAEENRRVVGEFWSRKNAVQAIRDLEKFAASKSCL